MASTTYRPELVPAQGLSAAERLGSSLESSIINVPPGNCDGNVNLQIRYGEITGIFGNAGCGKSLLGLHAVTTHLLAHPTSHAAWIDTVGSFSPGFLKGIVEERIVCARIEVERQEDAVKGKLSVEEVSRMVEGVLDRVWVMRAFDLWGVTEAVGEVRGHVEANVEVQSDNDPGREREEEVGVGCGEVEREVDDKEGIGRSQCIWVTDPITLPLPPGRSPSLPDSSPLSSPPPSSELFSPSPTFLQSSALPLPEPLTRGRTEIPDSDAGSDEDIVISSLSSSPPIHKTSSPPHDLTSGASPEVSTKLPSPPNSYLRDEIPASTGEKKKKGDKQINEGKDQYSRGEIPMSQSQYSQDNIHAYARGGNIDSTSSSHGKPTHPYASSSSSTQKNQYRTRFKVPVIGILVIDTITHPVESFLTKAAASAGVAAIGSGANTVGVGGAFALLEKFLGNLTEFVHQRGVSVLLLNNALPAPLYPPNPTWQQMEVIPALGPMFQHILDTNILLSRNDSGSHHCCSCGVPRGVQHEIEIEFRVVHDRNGEWTGETGKIGLGIGIDAGGLYR